MCSCLGCTAAGGPQHAGRALLTAKAIHLVEASVCYQCFPETVTEHKSDLSSIREMDVAHVRLVVGFVTHGGGCVEELCRVVLRGLSILECNWEPSNLGSECG